MLTITPKTIAELDRLADEALAERAAGIRKRYFPAAVAFQYAADPATVKALLAALRQADEALLALAGGLREGITPLPPAGSLGCDHRFWRAGVPLMLDAHADAIANARARKEQP